MAGSNPGGGGGGGRGLQLLAERMARDGWDALSDEARVALGGKPRAPKLEPKRTKPVRLPDPPAVPDIGPVEPVWFPTERTVSLAGDDEAIMTLLMILGGGARITGLIPPASAASDDEAVAVMLIILKTM